MKGGNPTWIDDARLYGFWLLFAATLVWGLVDAYRRKRYVPPFLGRRRGWLLRYRSTMTRWTASK